MNLNHLTLAEEFLAYAADLARKIRRADSKAEIKELTKSLVFSIGSVGNHVNEFAWTIDED